MVACLLQMANLEWAGPDYSTLRRRQKTLAVRIPYRRTDGLFNLLVDSTGIKFPGDGEWQVRKHGVQGRRQSLPGRRMRAFVVRGRKVHLAMDTAASDIRAVEFTPSRAGDIEQANATGSRAPARVLPELLVQIPENEQIGTVTADGAYDRRRCHTAIFDRQAVAILPIRKNGQPWKAVQIERDTGEMRQQKPCRHEPK